MERFYDIIEGPRELSPGRRNPVSKSHLLKSHDYLMLTRWLAVPMLTFAMNSDTDTFRGVIASTKALAMLTEYAPDVRSDWKRLEQKKRVSRDFALLEKGLPSTERCMMWHAPTHLTDQQWRFGGAHLTWMFPFDSFLGRLKRLAINKARPEANIMHGWRLAMFGRMDVSRFAINDLASSEEDSSESSGADDDDGDRQVRPPSHIIRSARKAKHAYAPGLVYRAHTEHRWRHKVQLDHSERRSIATLLGCPTQNVGHRVAQLTGVEIDGILRGSHLGCDPRSLRASRCGRPRSLANSELMIPPGLTAAHGKIMRFLHVNDAVIADVVVYANRDARSPDPETMPFVQPPPDNLTAPRTFIRWRQIGRQVAFAPAPDGLLCVVYSHYPCNR